MDGLQFSVVERAELIKAQNHLIDNLRNDITHQNEIIKSFERSQIVTDDIQKQLKKQTRSRKFWQFGAGAALVAGIGSSIYFLTR